MLSLRFIRRLAPVNASRPSAAFFAEKKKRRSSRSGGEESGSEGGSGIKDDLGLGDVKEIKSAPNHQPPVKEDSLTGRYATVLFQAASEDEALYKVYEDMAYLGSLLKQSEDLRLHTENVGVSAAEHATFKGVLESMGGLCNTTFRFLDVLFEQKRMMYLGHIGEKYTKLYQMFNLEEKIRVISAFPLSAAQETSVLEALKANPDNSGKEFTLSFEVDESIIGGLQLYTESKFMDLSVQSRMEKINGEIQRMTDL